METGDTAANWLCGWKPGAPLGNDKRKWTRGTSTPTLGTGPLVAHSRPYFVYLDTRANARGPSKRNTAPRSTQRAIFNTPYVKSRHAITVQRALKSSL